MRAVRPMPDIRELRLFDSCVSLGRLCLPDVVENLTAQKALAVMDKHDIAEALVHASEARLVRPRWRGNERLLKDLTAVGWSKQSRGARLHPVWVLEPPKGPDPAGANKMVEDMLSAGVRAARLMMGQVPPLRWMWQDLCAALEAHRVPCLLDFAPVRSPGTNCVPDVAAMEGLRGILAAHPHLPMILSHASGGLGLVHSTIPLMHRAANLLLDITAIVDYWREVARDLGPQRVVFASGMPFYDPAVLVSNVQYDQNLDLAAKKLICGDNLRRLLEGVR